jgi:hypothetical protein
VATKSATLACSASSPRRRIYKNVCYTLKGKIEI